MSVGNLYVAHFRFEGAGAHFTTQMCYKQSSGTNDENTLTSLATALAVILEADFKAAMSNQVHMTGITCFQVTGADETPGRTVFEQPNPGSIASQALPMGGPAVISLTTDAPNAKHNGRVYISGIPESGEVNGALTAGQITLINNLAVSLNVTPPPVGPGLAVFIPQVISKILDGVKRVPPVGFTIISSAVRGFIKNQRRRNTKFIGAGGTT